MRRPLQKPSRSPSVRTPAKSLWGRPARLGIIAGLEFPDTGEIVISTELYDEPQTEFVMRFVGEANRIGNRWVRPHDLDIAYEPVDGSVEAMVDRISRLGFEARVELSDVDGEPIAVQVTRDRLEELELEQGQIVWVSSERERVFAEL